MCQNQIFDWLIKKADIWQWDKRQVNVKHDCVKTYVYVKFLRDACFSFFVSNHSAVKREQIIFTLETTKRRQESGIGISFIDS